MVLILSGYDGIESYTTYTIIYHCMKKVDPLVSDYSWY
jgi:hypothetical protein